VDQKYYVSNKMMEFLQKRKNESTYRGYDIPNLNGNTSTLTARYYKDGSEILILDRSGNIKNKKIASTLTGGGNSGGNHSDMDLIKVPRKLTELTKNKSQGYRIYKPIISSSLNSGAGGLGARTGLYQTSKTDVRRLTPVECERLQGFPDGYTEGVSDTQRYKTLGNAVTVNVVTSLINKMFKGSAYDRTRK
jgi:site-specific DNA-cytosine methylase